MKETNFNLPEDIGSYLQDLRESKKMGISDISDYTKISPYFLKALEQGEWHKINSSFFVVSFVKAYCQALGASWDELASHVKRIAGEIEKKEGTQKYRELLKTPKPIIKKKRYAVFYLVVMSICFLMTTGGLYLINLHKPTTNRTSLDVAYEADNVPSGVLTKFGEFRKDACPDCTTGGNASYSFKIGNEDNVKEFFSNTKVTLDTFPAKGFAATTDNKDGGTKIIEAGSLRSGHRLLLEATDETWVKIWIDKKKPIGKLLAEGDKIEFEVKEKVKVMVGNGAAVKIYMDDKIFDNLGKNGQLVTFKYPDAQKRSSR